MTMRPKNEMADKTKKSGSRGEGSPKVISATLSTTIKNKINKPQFETIFN